MQVELSSSNLFSCIITSNEIKYSRVIEGKLYVLKASVTSKEDAFTKLQNISCLTNEIFMQYSIIQKRSEANEEI